ncbi:perforin-1 [Salmo salar]|uniref:Perforin-1 n=1 Tax=Salmo salar TaxID=8030 RepID=B5X1M0_SALSA|nr:perforin-1 [Salmo salar]ACI33201.1 Perforin-1 precursor [Salmo salar]
MSLLIVCLWAGLMLSLPRPSCQSCIIGSANECKEAEFAPGTNLAGEGFDITKMKRKGAFVIDMNVWKRKDKTCTLCENPYLEGKKQRLPLAVVDWRPNHQCSMKVSSKLHRSSESLVSSSSSSVENNWQVNLELEKGSKSGKFMLAGTNSKLAEYSMEKTKSDKFSFTSHSVSCGYYSYRVSGQPKLHREFKTAVKNLPKIYQQENKQRYYKLIDNFGTHYITKVSLGGTVQSVTSIMQCQASLQGLSAEEVKMCLDVEATASVGDSNSLKTEFKHCQEDKSKTESKASFSSVFNDRFTEVKGGHTTEPELLFSAEKDPASYKQWLDSLPRYPDIVSYSLESLHELLPTTNPARKHLRKAISDYILENALWKNCSEPCQTGIKSDHRDSCVCSCHNNPGVSADCCPTRKGLARVIITVQRGANLWGDHTTATDGYVKVAFAGLTIGRTRVIYNNNNPSWAMSYDLGTVDLSTSKKLRFEVWDEDDKWNDDLLGECEKELTAGVKEDLCNLQHGQMFYKWEVVCAPSLGGSACMDYVPSPMNPHLEKVYVSRHSRLIPKDMLVSMGVLVDEPNLHGNKSFSTGNRECGRF